MPDTAGAEGTSAPGADSGPAAGTGDSTGKEPSTDGASATSTPEAPSGQSEEPASRSRAENAPEGAGSCADAPDVGLSFESSHHVFNTTSQPGATFTARADGTTTPKPRTATGSRGTTAPDDRPEATSAPLSGNGSASENDWEREECYWVDPDGVIHDHPTKGEASAHPDTRNGTEASEATRSAGGAEPETAPHTDSHPGASPESDPDSGIGADADPGAGFTGDSGTSEDAGSVPEYGVGSRSGLRGEAKIFVTIPATSLAGLDDQDGMLSGYGPITADAIRELAGTAHTLYRILTDPNTGRPLALGRSSYRVDTQLREFLQLRSDTCQFPGCGVNARRTDADHITEWDTGGETNPENLQLLCRKHHNLKTHHGWEAKVLDPETNTVQWTSPLGNTYIAEPSGIYTSETGGCPDANHRSDSSDAGTGAGNGARTDTGSTRDPWGMTPEENATTDLSDAPF